MPFCKNCGEEIDYEVKVCPWCGAKVEEYDEDYPGPFDDYDSGRFYDDESEEDYEDDYFDEEDEEDIKKFTDDYDDEDYEDEERN